MKNWLAGILVPLMLFPLFLTHPAHAMDGDTVQMVRDATYRLYIRISPPGRKITQTMAFCSASFYRVPDDAPYGKEGVYGTTAGHCLDFYQAARQVIKDRVWGLEMELAVSPNDDRAEFVTLEPVSHGMRSWRRWVENREDYRRPAPENVQDWAIIKAPEGAKLNQLPLSQPDTVNTGESLYLSGYPYSLGKFWAQGTATYPYQLPGTAYDGYIGSDFKAAPGNSGSPVVDDYGRQVGILVAGIPGSVSLITPISVVRWPHQRSRHITHPRNSRQNYGSYYADMYAEILGPAEIPWDMDRLIDDLESIIAPYASAESLPDGG